LWGASCVPSALRLRGKERSPSPAGLRFLGALPRVPHPARPAALSLSASVTCAVEAASTSTSQAQIELTSTSDPKRHTAHAPAPLTASAETQPPNGVSLPDARHPFPQPCHRALPARSKARAPWPPALPHRPPPSPPPQPPRTTQHAVPAARSPAGSPLLPGRASRVACHQRRLPCPWLRVQGGNDLGYSGRAGRVVVGL